MLSIPSGVIFALKAIIQIDFFPTPFANAVAFAKKLKAREQQKRIESDI